MNDLITKIETFEPHPTEAIVISFNFNDTNLETMQQVFKHIEEKFPHNSIVAIPDYVSLQSWSKDVLENMISVIAEIIETL